MKESDTPGSYNCYERTVMDVQGIRELFKKEGLTGINITIPFKETALQWVDKVDPNAQSIGAINTIVKDGEWLIGYNTDIAGISSSLDELGPEKPTLVLGSGGAAKALCTVLEARQTPYLLVQRQGAITYSSLTVEQASKYPRWINCTPVGGPKYPGDYLPLPYKVMTKEFAIFDMNYEPNPTPMMLRGKEMGAAVIGGNLMLTEQAKEAWKLFHAAYYKNL
jgi:shikimate dehydrogenase